MGRPGSGTGVAAALSAAFLTVVSLVLPWFDILGKQRSSIDLITSASALDIIDGWLKVLVLAAWLGLPVIISIGMWLGAVRRDRLAALTVVPVALLTIAAFSVGAYSEAIDLAWGAIFAFVFAVIALGFAIMVLVPSEVAQ